MGNTNRKKINSRIDFQRDDDDAQAQCSLIVVRWERRRRDVKREGESASRFTSVACFNGIVRTAKAGFISISSGGIWRLFLRFRCRFLGFRCDSRACMSKHCIEKRMWTKKRIDAKQLNVNVKGTITPSSAFTSASDTPSIWLREGKKCCRARRNEITGNFFLWLAQTKKAKREQNRVKRRNEIIFVRISSRLWTERNALNYVSSYCETWATLGRAKRWFHSGNRMRRPPVINRKARVCSVPV